MLRQQKLYNISQFFRLSPQKATTKDLTWKLFEGVFCAFVALQCSSVFCFAAAKLQQDFLSAIKNYGNGIETKKKKNKQNKDCQKISAKCGKLNNFAGKRKLQLTPVDMCRQHTQNSENITLRHFWIEQQKLQSKNIKKFQKKQFSIFMRVWLIEFRFSYHAKYGL